jgi:carbon-monoxide dehydrogenase medium subunit
MVRQATTETFFQPTSVDAALAYLHDLGSTAMPLAGATWAMRAPLRHEQWPRPLVALNRITAMHGIEPGKSGVKIGALVTHDQLAQALPDTPDLHGLALAAAQSANPSVRRLATIGGNLCTQAFAAADLVPALLAAGATVQLALASGPEGMLVEAFLCRRAKRGAPWLLTGVNFARSHRFSAHERLTMRQAGDYPCAIVSLSVGLDSHGRIVDPRIAVGAVEPVARRWHSLEQALPGRAPHDAGIESIAAGLVDEFQPRDGVDAPGWYRLAVLPVLVRRAFETIQSQIGRRRQAWI